MKSKPLDVAVSNRYVALHGDYLVLLILFGDFSIDYMPY